MAPLTACDHRLEIDFGDTFPSRRTLRNQFLSIRHSQNHQPSCYLANVCRLMFPGYQNVDVRCPPFVTKFDLKLH